jgi:hypothetical protein
MRQLSRTKIGVSVSASGSPERSKEWSSRHEAPEEQIIIQIKLGNHPFGCDSKPVLIFQ